MPSFIDRYGQVKWTKQLGGQYSRDGACEVCGATERDLAEHYGQGDYTEFARRYFTRMVIDHCHAHGWVRGLLCLPCNNDMAHVENYRPDRWRSRTFEESAQRFADHWRKCPDCPAFPINPSR